MSRQDGKNFARLVFDYILQEAYFYATPAVRKASRTLAAAMKPHKITSLRGFLGIPHYWAVYRHDGRLRVPVFPRLASFMVWFRSPKDDPRLGGKFPERAADVRRLTSEEFRYWMERNRDAYEVGAPPPMIVTPVVYKPTRPTDFFLNDGGGGMSGFQDKIHADLLPEIRDFFLSGVPMKETDKVSIRL